LHRSLVLRTGKECPDPLLAHLPEYERCILAHLRVCGPELRLEKRDRVLADPAQGLRKKPRATGSSVLRAARSGRTAGSPIWPRAAAAYLRNCTSVFFSIAATRGPMLGGPIMARADAAYHRASLPESPARNRTRAGTAGSPHAARRTTAFLLEARSPSARSRSSSATSSPVTGRPPLQEHAPLPPSLLPRSSRPSGGRGSRFQPHPALSLSPRASLSSPTTRHGKAPR